MQQFWVTKKSVQRKLGGKEDECVVASDSELDAKLELFKSINESCTHMQRVVDLYQERLCYLAQEENALGRYLKEYGKNEKNACAGQIMTTAGKAIAYVGHQRLTLRAPLVRLHNEVETFRSQGVSDTRVTVQEMEKARTEYRAALSWMKSASAQLDPDTGHGLDGFRRAQAYVKRTKAKFDKLALACLQKIDLLAAARCNMFSHALVPYHSALQTCAQRCAETLTVAGDKLERQPFDGELGAAAAAAAAGPSGDRDKSLFFTPDYTDEEKSAKAKEEKKKKQKEKPSSSPEEDVKLLDIPQEPFEEEAADSSGASCLTSQLLDLSIGHPSSMDLTELMPSRFIQEGELDFGQFESALPAPGAAAAAAAAGPSWLSRPTNASSSSKSKPDTKAAVSWLNLFAELDPLANPTGNESDRA